MAANVKHGPFRGAGFDELGGGVQGSRTGQVVRSFVEAIADQLLTGRAGNWLPSTSEVPELAQFLLKLKPLAATAVSAALGHSLDHHVDEVLGDYIARLMPHLKHQTIHPEASREIEAS